MSIEPFLDPANKKGSYLLSNEDLHEAIMESCLDDSTKIIHYLKEQEQKQKSYNTAVLVFTLVSAAGGIIAAVTGILGLLK